MNAFIMADATKCIGCRTCEVACVVAHQQNQDCASVSSSAFIPRIRVIKDDAFTTAVACHQCEDAPCAMFVQLTPFVVNMGISSLNRHVVLVVKAVCWPARLGQ